MINFWFLLLNYSLSAQLKQLKDGKLHLSISPLAIVDYNDGSSIRLSVDFNIKSKFVFSTETFFYTSLGNLFSYKTNPRGIGVKPCLKYYFNEKTTRKYFGLEYQYKEQSYQLDDSFAITGIAPFYKLHNIKRFVNCVTLKYGQLQNINPYIVIEYFTGIGVRYRTSNTNLSTQEYNGIKRGEQYKNNIGGGASAREIGTTTQFNLSLGIKIGVKLF